MVNSLLDFVMSLVRDPDAAARYAADPAQAIADAHLTGVTSADVSNLIPMVSESLSMAAPPGGADLLGTGADANVWASGAATAAFDAFADQAPESVFTAAHTVAGDLIDDPDRVLTTGAGVLDDFANAATPIADSAIDDASLQFSDPVIDEIPHQATLPAEMVDHTVDAAQQIDDHAPGFDIFG